MIFFSIKDVNSIMQYVDHKGCFKHSVAPLTSIVSPSFGLNSNRLSVNQIHRASIDIKQYMSKMRKKKKKCDETNCTMNFIFKMLLSLIQINQTQSS